MRARSNATSRASSRSGGTGRAASSVSRPGANTNVAADACASDVSAIGCARGSASTTNPSNPTRLATRSATADTRLSPGDSAWITALATARVSPRVAAAYNVT